MRLAKVLAASVGLTVSGAAIAGGHVVNLEPGSGGVIRGHAGLHAVDVKTERALVRVVAPGLEVDKRGTIRVLVRNLGDEPFEFGPANVSLTLADGSEFTKIPVTEFERAYSLIAREQNRAAAVEIQTRSTLSALTGQASSGPSADSSAPGAEATGGRSDEYALPGGKTLAAMYEVLMPETVAPEAASGGYVVFDLPGQVKQTDADIPLTITVRTGPEEHRFPALLKWRR